MVGDDSPSPLVTEARGAGCALAKFLAELFDQERAVELGGYLVLVHITPVHKLSWAVLSQALMCSWMCSS